MMKSSLEHKNSFEMTPFSGLSFTDILQSAVGMSAVLLSIFGAAYLFVG